MNDILAKIWDNSVLFMDKSVKWFTKWCGGRDLTFFSVPSKRPKNEYADRISMRSFYVLEDKYINSIKKDIVQTSTEYQSYIEKLKDEEYIMTGYCRKPKSTNEDINKRIHSLQEQIGRLKTRSSVDKVYVSVNCDSKESIMTRDLKKSPLALELNGMDGNMQDLIEYLLTGTKACLVTIDSAGLPSDLDDLVSFLREFPNIEKFLLTTFLTQIIQKPFIVLR
ncbi:hypothetical protein G6F64_012307 [Rhizopus arrhizus]|uniref:Uncharacterized protein n=1 Tax=Rhizopus oryzae TaxID=64495 RepID=A0A9P6WXG9_RHIOR|nr:hypothetical protein G6F64_012307 [Rhizopus arrhizus]